MNTRIHIIRRAGTPPSHEDIRDTLQYIRKDSSSRYRSRANVATFGVAADEVAVAFRHMPGVVGAGSHAKVDPAAG